MKGQGVLDFYEIGEEYEFTFPALYVRGLLIGVMRMEIAGACASVSVARPPAWLDSCGGRKKTRARTSVTAVYCLKAGMPPPPLPILTVTQ